MIKFIYIFKDKIYGGWFIRPLYFIILFRAQLIVFRTHKIVFIAQGIVCRVHEIIVRAQEVPPRGYEKKNKYKDKTVKTK